jgi:hypothetical protein
VGGTYIAGCTYTCQCLWLVGAGHPEPESCPQASILKHGEFMIDFLENLLNRYTGIGEKVLLRTRARFEPDAETTFLAGYPQKNSLHLTSPTNSPANSTAENALDNNSPEKQPLDGQKGPVIESAEYFSSFVTKDRSIPETDIDVHMDMCVGKKKVHTNEPLTPDSQLRGAIYKDKTGNASDDKVERVSRRSSTLEKQGYLTSLKKKGTPIHGDMIDVQESYNKQQADQHLTVGSGVTSEFPVEPPKPEFSSSKPLLKRTIRKNAGIGYQGLLGTPAGLSLRESESDRRLFNKNSKAETEPVINVTIGRIEVKATKLREPEQPRQQKKASGVMSLDKYLSQFGRGGRR